ncbi:MAG: hypothetical protein SNJ70_01485 [Armatimonadota bacterium]
MIDDYKYSVGRLVVYKHSDPRLPRQSYGQFGPQKTVGEILAVDIAHNPQPHWIYTIRNIRNNEIVRTDEKDINFVTSISKQPKKSSGKWRYRRYEDLSLADIISRSILNPDKDNILRSTIKDILFKEEMNDRAIREGANLPIDVGDYIRIKGSLRVETEDVHNHYAKILSVETSDIAGIENTNYQVGEPTVIRTLKKYNVITSEGIDTTIYDAEVKVFYTAMSRKTILNWRAATLLSEVFGDDPPYRLEFEYISDHIYTRDELKQKKRSELSSLLASILYVKGRIGWKDYQRKNHIFSSTPKSHLIDFILEASRFDFRKNRIMTDEEIEMRKKESYKLRRLLKNS